MIYTADSAGFLALDGVAVPRDIIAGGDAMPTRRALVLHFTGGASGASSIEAMRSRGVSAHLVVERNGSVTQCRPFTKTAGHAGVSRWVDPKTGTKYTGCNGFTIGIEIANAGDDEGAQNWAVKHAGAKLEKAKHRNESGIKTWEVYPPAQVAAVAAICYALVSKYNLDDITGHDCIAPERKLDPGPLFPMQDIREACGFKGLPTVHHP
jgi:N-acetylmuramoyl-L-alanine amidase